MKKFEPALYSLAELQFIHEHIGEPPVVALSTTLPKGVNPVAAREILNTVYELEQLREHKGMAWEGIASIKTAIERFQDDYARNRELFARGAPRFPSMHAWDMRNRPHRGGVGSDSKYVRTTITNDGGREDLGVDLLPTPGGSAAFTPPWARSAEPLPTDLVEDPDKGFIQCPLCGYAQNYQKESTTSRNTARSRVARHCKTYRGNDETRHRELYTHIFG